MRAAPGRRPVRRLEIIEQATLAAALGVKLGHDVQIIGQAADRDAAKVAQRTALGPRHVAAGGERVRDEGCASVRRLQGALGNALGA